MNIHFIGVGKMGLPMALHLQAAGHHLTASDTDPAQQRIATAAGLRVLPAEWSETRSAMANAELVFSSLPDDAALLAVAQQIAAGARPGAVWVETSTVSPQASAQAGQQCDERGVLHLRASVSGNNHMAQAAQLTVLASGPRSAFEFALPALKLLGPYQFYLGAAEESRMMKLVLNLMIAQTSAMLAEGLTLGQAGGLDWRDMWQVIAASPLASPIVKAKGQQLMARDYTPTFTVPQMIKDLDLIVAAAASHHAPVPQTAATLQQMHAAIAQGDGALDYASIIRVQQRGAGLATELAAARATKPPEPAHESAHRPAHDQPREQPYARKHEHAAEPSHTDADSAFEDARASHPTMFESGFIVPLSPRPGTFADSQNLRLWDDTVSARI